jgi:hypothetical protein
MTKAIPNMSSAPSAPVAARFIQMPVRFKLDNAGA